MRPAHNSVRRRPTSVRRTTCVGPSHNVRQFPYSPPVRIVIAGGSGFLGSALVRALRGDGHDIVVLTRGSRVGDGQVRWTPDGSTAGWAAVVDGAGAVVNLAGASIAGARWTLARKQELRDSRVLSTRSVARAIVEAHTRPSVFVNASAVGYYGPRGGEEVTESSAAGHDFLGTLAVAWESAARAVEDLGVRVVLLRTGLVLDPQDGALGKMLTPFRLGVGGPFGSGRQYMPWIHRQDWVDLVRWALTAPDARGPLNATAPAPITNEEFAATLGRVLQRPAVVRAPAFALRLALGELADAILTGQRAVPERALTLGYRFSFPALEPALRDLLDRR